MKGQADLKAAASLYPHRSALPPVTMLWSLGAVFRTNEMTMFIGLAGHAGARMGDFGRAASQEYLMYLRSIIDDKLKLSRLL